MVNRARVPASGASVVTVGTYDGVHLGHQRLIAESLAHARREGLPLIVVTFDRLPADVVRPGVVTRLLTGLEHKLELLEETGADAVEVLAFDERRAREAAEDFVATYLLGELGAEAIYVGTNFRFGHRAAGDLALLEDLGAELGYSAHGVALVTDDESARVVSSTGIRALVAAGELEEAARLLGRRHEVRGVLAPDRPALVVHGALALPPPGRYEVEVAALREPGSLAIAEIPAVAERATEVLVGLDKAPPQLEEWQAGESLALRFA